MSSSSPSAGNTDGPLTPRQQRDYSFSGRVLLTAVVILAILTVVFVLIRLLLYQLVARGRGRGGLAAGVRRSLGRSARRGLDASALAALPVTTYRRKPGDGDGSKGPAGSSSSSSSSSIPGSAAATSTECAVCLSELDDGEKVRALPACAHVFHVECVDAWLRSRTTCPVCRAEVRPPKGTADARPSSAPPLFGAGGALIVTVHGGAAEAETRDARTYPLGSGQPAGGAVG